MKDTDRYFIFLLFHAEAIFDPGEMGKLECLICFLFCLFILIFIEHKCIFPLDHVLM